MFKEGWIFSPEPAGNSGGSGSGRYRLEEHISDGYEGSVWKAWDLHLKTYTAIKFSKLRINADGKDENPLFFEEAQRAAALAGHPNVVFVRDFGHCLHEGKKIPFIAFEYLGDGNLDSLVKSKKPNLDKILEACRDAFHGLQHMHQNEFVHRDIKPLNLLYAPGNTVKICDFGFAKDLRIPRGSQSKMGAGTPGFIAPEQLSYQWDKIEIIDQMKVDVFQMGVTAYVLLAGKLPFGVTYDADELRDLMEKGPPPIDRIDVPPEIWDMICLMLSKYRPGDIGELLPTLKEVIGNRGFTEHNLADNIREALKKKIVRVFDLFAGKDSRLVPLGGESPDWYATVLLRPTEESTTGDHSIEGKMADVFHPIYLPHYFKRELRHSCDWILSRDLAFKPLRISECCSGLVIRWYEEDHEWRDKGLYSEEFFFVKSDSNKRIRYAVCRDVREARSNNPKDGARLVHSHYATDILDEYSDGMKPSLEWEMRNEDNGTHRMSKDIQTEILVPIYKPKSLNTQFGSEDILGVANFEWDEKFSREREQEIGEQLAEWIQDQHQFPVSAFLSQVVEIVLPQYKA